MTEHVLVAAVGNIFLGDDGFGRDVALALGRRGVPEGVVVRDFGTRTVDLEIALEAAAAGVVIDVVRKEAAPGTLYVLDPDSGEESRAPGSAPGHSTTSTEVILRMVARSRRGENPRALRVVGCVPSTFGDVEEGALGLSDAVTRAIEPAADLAIEVAGALAKEVLCTSSR